MAEITAGMVKELRERTDAPMMDCKKALTEAEGDMTRAEEILRVRFGNKASKAAGRVAAEGTVGVSIAADGKSGAMIEVNSETDFCAKNEDFLAFTADLAKTVAASNAVDIAAVGALAMRGATVEETRAQLVGKIGENITPRRFVKINASAPTAAMSAALLAATVFAKSAVKAKKSSFFAQKSVSEFTSIIAPDLPSAAIKTPTVPSAATRPAALLALLPKRTRNISSARVMSPSASVKAFLQSIIGASVRSRNSFTMPAVISILFSAIFSS